MMGEELNAADVTGTGLLGDRGYALTDATSGKVVSAKNPRKWPVLFDFRAMFVEPPRLGQPLPPVRVTLPDGTTLASHQADAAAILSRVLGAPVRMEASAPPAPILEEYWPDIEGLDRRDTVTDESMPPATFFDCAAVHLLTTATLDRLRQAYPEGRFETRRFRPNIVVQSAAGMEGFVESDWVGHTLAIGEQVRLRITGPCPRCVMTTLPQGDLPPDAGILRTASSAEPSPRRGVCQRGAARPDPPR